MTAVKYPMLIPLSPAQNHVLRGWGIDNLYHHTFPVSIRLPQGFCIDDAVHAVTQLYDRHQALRSRLAPTADGHFLQEIRSAHKPDFTIIDVKTHDSGPESPTPSSFDELAVSEPVDPTESAGRIVLRGHGRECHEIELHLHHIFSDGYGRGLLEHELQALLLQRTMSSPGQITTDRTALCNAHCAKNTKYWLQRFAHPKESWLTSRREPRQQTVRSVIHRLRESPARALHDRARQLAVSPLALWATAAFVALPPREREANELFEFTASNRRTKSSLQCVDELDQIVYESFSWTPGMTLTQAAQRWYMTSRQAAFRGLYDSIRIFDDIAINSMESMLAPALGINCMTTEAGAVPHGHPLVSGITHVTSEPSAGTLPTPAVRVHLARQNGMRQAWISATDEDGRVADLTHYAKSVEHILHMLILTPDEPIGSALDNTPFPE